MTTKSKRPPPAGATHEPSAASARPKKHKKAKHAGATVDEPLVDDGADLLPSTSGGGGGKANGAASAPDLDEADAIAATAGAPLPVPAWADGLPDFRNRERVLILSTRGITHR
jgi:hypothetical protein